MKKQLLNWLIYSIMISVLLTPFFIKNELGGFLEIVSVSFIIGFFAGILNKILSSLYSINKKLKKYKK